MAHMKRRDSNRRRREDRQIQAKVRQEAHEALTVEQKIAKLGNLPAVKERAKLTARAVAIVSAAEVATSLDAARKADVVLKVERKGQKAKRQARKDKKSDV